MRRLRIAGFGDVAQRVVPLTARLVAARATGGSLPQHFVNPSRFS